MRAGRAGYVPLLTQCGRARASPIASWRLRRRGVPMIRFRPATGGGVLKACPQPRRIEGAIGAGRGAGWLKHGRASARRLCPRRATAPLARRAQRRQERTRLTVTVAAASPRLAPFVTFADPESDAVVLPAPSADRSNTPPEPAAGWTRRVRWWLGLRIMR